MCWKAILGSFIKPPTPPLALLHPQEPMNPNATMENTSIRQVLTEWANSYEVPLEYQPYWFEAIIIKLSVEIPYPAGTWTQDGMRHLTVRPEWCNPGVIAHEQAHNSYALLTNDKKEAFTRTYMPLVTTDRLIKYLYSKNNYGLTSVIEGHAEVYRYLGKQMPDSLKQYYPKLF